MNLGNDDALRHRLGDGIRTALDSSGRPDPDLTAVLRRSARLRWRRATGATSMVAATILTAIVAYTAVGPTDGAEVGAAAVYPGSAPPLEEIVPEGPPAPLGTLTDRAATFSVRALAQAGLLDPFGRYFGYRGIEGSNGRWRVAFVALTCSPVPGRVCDGDGSDETAAGRSPEDSWLLVAVVDGTLRLTGVDGEITNDDLDRMRSYQEPAEPERAAVEFPAVGTVHTTDDSGLAGPDALEVRAAGLWTGPLAPRDMWTVCQVLGFDGDGDLVYRGDPMADHPVAVESMRSGWFLTTGIPDAAGAARAEVRCVNWTAETWRAYREPTIGPAERPDAVTVGVRLRWPHHKLRQDSHCLVTVFDDAGVTLGTGAIAYVFSPWDDEPREIERETDVVVGDPARAERAKVECLPGPAPGERDDAE